jgi:hypothetical protein
MIIMNGQEIWRLYEAEKQKIIDENLSGEEYERRIRDLVDRLGL